MGSGVGLLAAFAGGLVSRPGPRRVVRTVGVMLVVLALWAGLAATRPEVTYHLAPALVVWAAPWTYGAARRRDQLAATGVGLVAAVGGATVLHAVGWLAGPVLFGADAFAEAITVSVAAALLACAAVLVTARAEAGAGDGQERT